MLNTLKLLDDNSLIDLNLYIINKLINPIIYKYDNNKFLDSQLNINSKIERKLILQLKKIFEYIGLRFLSLKSKSTLSFFIYLLFSVFIFDAYEAGTNFPKTINNQIDIDYLESRNELEDYIIAEHWMTPREFRENYRCAYGAGFSISPNLT